MPKKRRTTIIIEEDYGDDKSHSVFVDGKELTEVKKETEKKERTTKKSSTKKTSSKKKSTSTTSKKKTSTTSAKKKSTSKKKTTRSKEATTTKKTNKPKETTNKKKDTIKTDQTSNIIALPVLNEEKDNSSLNLTEVKNDKEESNKSLQVVTDNSLVSLKEQELKEVKNDEESKKEVIDNPEILDPEKEENKKEKENNENKKLDVIDTVLHPKEKEETPENLDSKEETNSLENEEKDKAPQEKEEIKQIDEDKIEEKLEDKTSVEAEDTSPVSDKNPAEPLDSSENKENKEKQNIITIDNKPIEVIKSDSNEKTNTSKKNKIIPTLVLSISFLVILALAIALPIILNRQDSDIKEINEEDINKDNFLTKENFFNSLKTLSFDYTESQTGDPSLTLEIEYSNINDVYYYKETTFTSEEENIIEITSLENSGDEYKVKETNNETITFSESEVESYLKDKFYNYFVNYFSYDSKVKENIISQYDKKTLYYYSEKNDVYILKDEKDSSYNFTIDKNGIIVNAEHFIIGDPSLRLLGISTIYTLK